MLLIQKRRLSQPLCRRRRLSDASSPNASFRCVLRMRTATWSPRRPGGSRPGPSGAVQSRRCARSWRTTECLTSRRGLMKDRPMSRALMRRPVQLRNHRLLTLFYRPRTAAVTTTPTPTRLSTRRMLPSCAADIQTRHHPKQVSSLSSSSSSSSSFFVIIYSFNKKLASAAPSQSHTRDALKLYTQG